MQSSVYERRRLHLMGELPDNALVIVSANTLQTRSHDTNYPFRQDSHFYYLTGFNEPNAYLMMEKRAGKVISHVFNQPRDATKEQWDGKRLGQLDAPLHLKVDAAFDVATFKQALINALDGMTHLYFCLGRMKALDTLVLSALEEAKKQVRKGVQPPLNLTDLHPLLCEMRLIKDEHELSLIRHACKVSANAHKHAMKACKTLEWEYQIEALIAHDVGKEGCRHMAYDSIVAAGSNACVLHYIQNDAPLNQGELLLIDAGGEYGYYAADITRTFPISGKFSTAQRQIYQCVLDAQLKGIECIKPGVCWTAIQQEILHVLTQGLIEFGIIEGSLEQALERKAYLPFYMHNSGHWLGIDVHDEGTYKQGGTWRTLQAGMVLTVEPGLYFANHLDIPDAYKGIGVRIEDDILVTDTGYEILTSNVPKTIDAIEQWMA